MKKEVFLKKRDAVKSWIQNFNKNHLPLLFLHHIFINMELIEKLHWKFHWKLHWKLHCSEKFCENYTGCVDLSEKIQHFTCRP